MNELDTRRIIREVRMTTRNTGRLSTAEVTFVLDHKLLSLKEKLLWLHIAAKTAHLHAFCCRLTEAETQSLLGNEPNAFSCAIVNLEKQHFLHIYEEKERGNLYTLSLPEEGLDALLDAAILWVRPLKAGTMPSSFKDMMNLYKSNGKENL